jgi:hypothetical protein
MKYIFYLLPVIVLVLSLQTCSEAEAAPFRFKIHNQISGMNFQVESPTSATPALQPEWGVPAHEERCDLISAERQLLITGRSTVTPPLGDPYDLCQLRDEFSIVTEDMATEIATQKTDADAKAARRALFISLKDKSTSLTATEIQQLLKAAAAELAK